VVARSSAFKRFVNATPVAPVAHGLIRAYRHWRLDDSAKQELRYDRLTVEVMERVLRPDSNCIDAGAHAGKFLGEIVRLAPAGTHYAFEPLPGMAQQLAEEFPGVRVQAIALGDQPGTVPFRRVVDNEPYSGFERRPWDTYDEKNVEIIHVDVRPLDEVIPIDVAIRFIKVDVEGSEFRLFRGARRLIAANKPVVAFELSSDHVEVFDLLTEIGMEVSLLDGWLGGKPALSRERFLDEANGLRNWTFLAHAPRG
jgi:FkbM family methyltransferase